MPLRAFSKKGSVGDRLKGARTERGLDLERVSADTRIRAEDLESLERDAPPEAFRGPLFARIYLREYARYLGLNPRPLLEAYREAHPEPSDRPLVAGSVSVERRPGRWLGRALVLLSVAILGGLAIYNAREGTPEPVPSGPMGPSPASPAPSPTRTTEDAAQEVIQGIRLVLEVVDAPCWIEIQGDGELLSSGTQQPGFSEAFRADEVLEITLGNPGATRLTVNGDPLTPGESGQVYQATLSLEDGEIQVSGEEAV